MDSIDVKRPVTVKVVMTPDFRKQLINEALETISRINQNLKAIDENTAAQLVGVGQSDSERTSAVKVQMASERDRMVQMKSELEWKIKEMENVEDGAELPFRVFEGTTTVRVGDNFLSKISNAEVVLKDWQVVEIRNA